MSVEWGKTGGMGEIQVALLGIAVGAAVPAILWMLDHRRAKALARAAEARERAAEERAQAAEQEILAMRRRGDAPYLTADTSRRFNALYPILDGKVCWLSVGNPALLCWHRDEIGQQVPAGQKVFLVVDNIGNATRSMTIELDGKPIVFGTEADMKGAHGLQFLQYDFDPGLRGRKQEMRLSFESDSGRKDTHVYALTHGKRVLRRIDPA